MYNGRPLFRLFVEVALCMCIHISVWEQNAMVAGIKWQYAYLLSSAV